MALVFTSNLQVLVAPSSKELVVALKKQVVVGAQAMTLNPEELLEQIPGELMVEFEMLQQVEALARS